MAERVIRAVGSLILIGLLTGAVWWVASQSQEVERSSRGPDIPGGPRYTLASGRFDDRNWGVYEGETWRFVVWGDAATHCFRLEVGDPQEKHGISCSTETPRSRSSGEHILARMFDPGGGNNGKIKSIAVGALSQEVARIEFNFLSDDVTDVMAARPLRPPAAAGLNEHFYVMFLPPAPGRIVAYDIAGQVLDTKPFCDRDCQRYLAHSAQN